MSAIRADVTAQLRLLDLQAVDSALAQLGQRRRTLPEAAEVERLEAELTGTSTGRLKFS